MRTSHRRIACAVAITALLIGSRSPGPADAAPQAHDEADARAIGELFHRLAAATSGRDWESFRANLTDEWTYFTSGGSEVGFEGFRKLISGWAKLEIVVSDILPQTSRDGRLAWSTFRGRLRGESNGEAVDRTLRFTAIVHRGHDGWKLRHLQSTIASPSR